MARLFDATARASSTGLASLVTVGMTVIALTMHAQVARAQAIDIVTVGRNRFRPPQPVEAWPGVRLADTWGDQALPNVNLNPVGAFWGDEFYYDPAFAPKASENGLNLNVFTPAARGLFRRVVIQSASGGLLDATFPTGQEKEPSNAAGIEKLFGEAS